MGIAPGIALQVQQPQVANPVDEYQRGMQIKSLIGQQQLQQQQVQAAQTEQQQRQLALQQQQQDATDRDAFNKSFKDANGDWDTAIKNAGANGMSGQGVLKYQLARTDQVSKMATMQKELLANEAAKADQYSKDAYQVQQVQDPDAKSALWTTLRNGHIAAGTAKPGDIPVQVPDDDTLSSIVNSHKATADMAKEAIALQEQKAKLPGEKAEATAKQYATAAQTMNGANEPLSWTARRNMAVANDSSVASLIPEQYTPQAAEQVRQLGVAPKDLANQAVDKLELAAFMKNPPKGYPPTPVGFLQFKSDQSANAQVRAMQNLMGGAGGGAPLPQSPGGGGGAPAAPAGPANTPATPASTANAPGGWVSSTNGRTLNAVNPMLRARLQSILEYRAPDPPQGSRGAIPQALSGLVAEFDPQHDATTFPVRNKTVTDFTKDASTGEIGAINTALGHLGELYKASQALSQNNIPILHQLASKYGLATGDDAASTYQSILHRVGPEMTKAYLKSGGTEGERGANESDFDINKGATQIVSNIAESAQLLNSKLASKRQSWDTGFKPYRDADQFDNRFLTPDAKNTLNSLSALAPTNRPAAAGTASAPPAGATHTGTSSKDGKKYWLDADGKKLGLAQ
jgi:hypothetical protein